MCLRRSGREALRYLRAHTALVQLVGVVICIPALIFPTHVPTWAIRSSLAGLAVVLAVGYLLVGRLFVRTPMDVSILLLLLLMPTTLLITPDRALTLPHVYKVIGSVALFYGVVGVLAEKEWFGLAALTVGALGVGLAGLVLLGTRWSNAKVPWVSIELYRFFPRFVRPFWNVEGFNSNIAGGTLAMLLPVPIAYLLADRRLAIRLSASLEIGFVGLVLLLTQSRGAMVALAAAVVAMLIARDRRWLVATVILVVLCAVVLQVFDVDGLLFPASDPSVENAVHSLQGRLELWSRGWMMLQDFPFTGVGMGTVVRVMPVLYPTFVVPVGIEHVHNLYLETGADLGFPGLIATLAFLLGMFHASWCAARRATGTGLEPLSLGMLGVLVVFAVHGLSDNLTFYARGHFIAWALFGVAVAVGMRFIRDGEPATPAADSR